MGRALTLDVERRFRSGASVAAKLDLPLGAGDVVALFGPSGAGKTTVLRMIAGLERPDRGVVRFDGNVWFDADRRVDVAPQQRRVGFVFQQPALFPHLTVRANVAFGVSGSGAGERVRGLLVRVGVGHLADRLARGLSGGEAQRVALARALAVGPALLLLDEPFAAVDAPARARLRSDLRLLVREAGVPAVLVTHDRSEVLALGDRIAVMIDGRVRQVGDVAGVLGRPADADVARAVGVETVLEATVAAAERGLVSVRIGATTVNAVGGPEPVVPGTTVLACIRAEDVTIERHAPARTSARNHLRGTIVRIDPEGPLDRVTIDCGFPLVALITRQSREDLRLAGGVPVTAAIKATAIHLVPRP